MFWKISWYLRLDSFLGLQFFNNIVDVAVFYFVNKGYYTCISMAEFHLKMAGTPPPISMPYWFDCQIRSLPSLVVFIVTHLWFIFIFIIIYMFFLRRRLKRLLYGWASAEYDKSLKALISVLNIEMASYRCYSVGSFEVTNVLTYQLTSVFRIRLWTNTIFILSKYSFRVGGWHKLSR